MTRMSVVVVAALVARVAGAQESPGVFTPAERRCESTLAITLAGYAVDVSRCVSDCFATTPAAADVCASPALRPPRTARCLDLALVRATTPVAHDCAGAACAECQATGDCAALDLEGLDRLEEFAVQTMSVVRCDDSASADGLTGPEARCQSALASLTGRYTATVLRCERRCRNAARDAATDEDACAALLLDSPLAAPSLQACVDHARRRLETTLRTRCADRPECFFPDAAELFAGYLEQPLYAYTPELFCADRRPCGDGFVSEGEACDWRLDPFCPTDPGLICGPTCQCEPEPVCGDGVLHPFEVCDPTATPNGCGDGGVCQDCFLCTAPQCEGGDETCEPPPVEPPPACGG